MAREFAHTKRSLLLRTAAAGAIAALTMAAPAQAIVPNDNFTPADIVDNAGGVNGVGMFFRNDGFVCSGTLINPRTVIFAAHCVNSNPETDFGPNIQSAFSFDVNALPGFINWINNGFASNPDLFVYNINQIFYNADSLARPDGFGFLEADVALASLDTPAANIPTWALLFSALPTPGAIDPTTGTGYHVNITGYGRSGSGSTGATTGIDWRRRAAENMLGALTSFDSRNEFLFGGAFGDLPQVLYRLDFDDPNKTNPFDFNLFKDEPLANEGTTAGGDSGGPLVLDAANNAITDEDLVIGVLSGGSRFFGPQPFSSYGTSSFYQPLFLFWDYIAANNPYRYVGAVAGDGAWEDASHWVSNLDPAYRVIDANGNIVNGVPTTLGEGILGDTPQFGEVCFDPEGANPGDGCQDLANGNFTPPSRETGGTIVSGIGQVDLGSLNLTGVASSELAVGGEAAQTADVVEAVAVNEAPAATAVETAEEQPQATPAVVSRVEIAENVAQGRNGLTAEEQAQGNGVDFAIDAPQAGVELAENEAQADDGVETAEEQPQVHNNDPAPVPNPAPTIDNGLAGATDFVPDNIDPPSGVNGTRRYFDVTLNQAGTTTLSSAVTIDRLTVSGAAGLDIDAAGNLTSLIDVTQTGGTMNVDGSLTSVGDYLLLTGMLSGSGTVQTPFLTSVAGIIAPGGMGTIGTLTIDGSAVFSSGAALLIDLGASGTSDVLAITGDSSLGGTVAFAPVAGFNSQGTSNYTILTTGGTQTGTFTGGQFVSAILQAAITYNPNSVDITVTTGSYQNAIDPANAVQVSYAALMDRNRGVGSLGGLFQTLDFLDAATIQAIFDSWAPTTESTVQSMARGLIGNVSDFHQNRISLADRSNSGGTVAVIGRPVQLAAASLGGFGISGGSAVLSDVAANATDSEVRSGGVNEDMAVYLAGGFVNGDGGSMPRGVQGRTTGEDNFDGFFIAGGLEWYFDESSFIGGSIYYSDIDADVALGNTAAARAIVGSIYGRAQTFGDLILDARISVGTYNAKTARNVALGTQVFTLTTNDDSFMFAGEVGLTKELDVLGVIVAPGIRGRAAKVNFSNVNEVGGGPALAIIRPDYNSIQGLAGLEFKSKPGNKLQLRTSMNYVHEFNDNPNFFGANFVGGTGLLAPFALVNQDRNWGEVGVGLRYNHGNMSFDLAADTTVGRSDVQSQVYSGAVTFRF